MLNKKIECHDCSCVCLQQNVGCGKCWYRDTEKPNRQPKFGVKNRLKPTGNTKSRTVTTLHLLHTYQIVVITAPLQEINRGMTSLVGWSLRRQTVTQAYSYYRTPIGTNFDHLFLVMDDFKISKLDRFRFDFLKKIQISNFDPNFYVS